MKITPGTITAEPHETLLITGKYMKGMVTLADGTEVDVTPEAIAITNPEQVEEVNFLIGEHWVKNGHPDDVEVSDEDDDSAPDGELVQRPFVHVHPKKFDNHPGKFKGKPAGTKRKPKKKVN